MTYLQHNTPPPSACAEDQQLVNELWRQGRRCYLYMRVESIQHDFASGELSVEEGHKALVAIQDELKELKK